MLRILGFRKRKGGPHPNGAALLCSRLFDGCEQLGELVEHRIGRLIV